ncbi:MAG: hypothetical protein JHC81_05010 [Brevundimonas sp.]|uniref:hypothetical protein n=1 Tax=Brevundimonas sp. TaxID=1871086 RepID=UPI001A2B1E9D|nr:hypothetical protein [Brevundimonas sp.]MBJ7446875.1 hypothetical protein [Brevundimonas sp.]
MTVVVEHKPSLLRKIAVIILLAGSGGAVGYAASYVTRTRELPWPDALALLMAVTLIATGIIGAITMARRPASVPKGCGLLQIAVMGLAGVLFILPIFATRWIDADMVFVAVVALAAVQTIANVMLWRRADEMLRRVMMETGAIAFWAGQMALFVYAAAERLGLVGTVSAWGLMGILMALYFFASMIAALRRGLT